MTMTAVDCQSAIAEFSDTGSARSAMPFVLTKDRIRSAVDSETNSRLVIDSTPELEYLVATFTSPDVTLQATLVLREKKSLVTNDTVNPAVMISAGDLNFVFQQKQMFDFDYNTKLVEYLVRMIAFVIKHHSVANPPYLWSNYGDLASRREVLYQMPSNEELLKISLEAD